MNFVFEDIWINGSYSSFALHQDSDPRALSLNVSFSNLNYIMQHSGAGLGFYHVGQVLIDSSIFSETSSAVTVEYVQSFVFSNSILTTCNNAGFQGCINLHMVDSAEIIDSQFFNNAVVKGGLVFAADDSHVSFIRCQFLNNTGGDSVLYFFGSNLAFFDVQVMNNGGGGLVAVVRMDFVPRCTFDLVTVSNNVATAYTLQVNDNSTLAITNSLIANNTANQGGGVAVLYQANLIAQSSTFNGNTAIAGGGFYSKHGSIRLTNVTVTANVAHSGGAGLCRGDGAFSDAQCVFSDNVSLDKSPPLQCSPK